MAAGSCGASREAALCCAAFTRLWSRLLSLKHMKNAIPTAHMMAGKVMDKEMILKTWRLPLDSLPLSANHVQKSFLMSIFIEIGGSVHAFLSSNIF